MKDRVDQAFDEKTSCVWATTSDEGFPDISIGSTFIYDDDHVAYWDRSFGASSTNLEKIPTSACCMTINRAA